MTRVRSAPENGPPAGATPALIRWGAVVGGGVIGLSLFVLLSALWAALGFGTGVPAIETNLNWFLAASAIVAMFVGGLLAGWLSGVPGFAPGFFNGVTVWAVVLIVSLAIGTPGALQTIGLPATEEGLGALAPQGDVLWAGFVALLVGALAAGLGGGLGGVSTRPAFVYTAPPARAHPEPMHRAEPAAEPAGPARTVRLPEEEPERQSQ